MRYCIKRYILCFIIVILVVLIFSCTQKSQQPQLPTLFHAQGEMAGELTQTSVILQSRLTATDGPVDGDVPGSPGVACFELSTVQDFSHYLKTKWIEAVPEYDYIIKTKLNSLKPGTRYFYRLLYSTIDDTTMYRGDVCAFKTHSYTTVSDEINFVVVTGMNYKDFHIGDGNPDTAYRGADKHLGYPALETILNMDPDFFIGTGDNVYYDQPKNRAARTVTELRKKWHEQFVQERFKKLFARIPTYWEKDDHDYRYNNADATNIPGEAKPSHTELPSHELGISTFLEQVPVTDPDDPNPKTYRTHRINKLLQIWFVEGRDYRSPNSQPDGPDKTIWGVEQKSWLKKTILASDADFKILISPTPMVGPDDAYKLDNHVNQKGFKHEGEKFFTWLKDNGFLDKNFYIICGDRHWQYHSIHPSGFEEFSTGAIIDLNARLGRNPGDPESTDPDALVKQIFTSPEPSGGFLRVTVKPGVDRNKASTEFTFHDESGVVLYSVIKAAR